jgi:hypothetical protein
MKTSFTLVLFMISAFSIYAQDTLKLSDFEILKNSSWKGNLTYKDYQSGKQTTIDATMQIFIKGEKLISKIQYTYEPNKNNTSSVRLKKNGTYYGNEKVVSNTYKNGIRTFVTTYDGKDNNKKATFFITHEFGESYYKVTKEVQLKNSLDRFTRNTYTFKRI